MSNDQLDKSMERVAFLMDKVPGAKFDYKTLIISYWQIFDGVDIPTDVLRQILQKGSEPETISRSRRKVLEQDRVREYLELQRMAQAQE